MEQRMVAEQLVAATRIVDAAAAAPLAVVVLTAMRLAWEQLVVRVVTQRPKLHLLVPLLRLEFGQEVRQPSPAETVGPVMMPAYFGRLALLLEPFVLRSVYQGPVESPSVGQRRDALGP